MTPKSPLLVVFITILVALCTSPIFAHNVTTRRLISGAQIGDSAQEFQSKQRNILSNLWLLLLKSISIRPVSTESTFDPKTKREVYDDISIYTRIYAVLDTQ